MWRIIKTRIKQGYRTLKYSNEEPVFPERFRGKPILKSGSTSLEQNTVHKEFDPTSALSTEKGLEVDLGKLLFNEDIKKVCPPCDLVYSRDYRMAVTKREDLILKNNELKLASALKEKTKKFLDGLLN